MKIKYWNSFRLPHSDLDIYSIHPPIHTIHNSSKVASLCTQCAEGLPKPISAKYINLGWKFLLYIVYQLELLSHMDWQCLYFLTLTTVVGNCCGEIFINVDFYWLELSTEVILKSYDHSCKRLCVVTCTASVCSLRNWSNTSSAATDASPFAAYFWRHRWCLCCRSIRSWWLEHWEAAWWSSKVMKTSAA